MQERQPQYYTYAVGKRKSSVAQVRLYAGVGGDGADDEVNGRPLDDMFPWDSWRQLINEPFAVAGVRGQFRVVAKIRGGGVVSQAGALRHAISRALQIADPSLRTPLKRAGLLTRDAREKERKKYGLARARKAKQWTKR